MIPNRDSKDSLKTITTLAESAKRVAVEIEVIKKGLKEAEKSYTVITEILLPDAMSEANLSYVCLADGTPVHVFPFHAGYITVEKRDAAHHWLEEHGHGGLIKRTFTAVFAHDEDASAFRVFAKDVGLHTEERETIHASTLNAWIRQQVESGEEIPQDLISVYSCLKAKVG